MTTLQDTINQTKGDYLHAKERLTIALTTTPDDRINWSPSPSARTPIQQAAHAAVAVYNITETLEGRPYHVKVIAEADKGFREWEAQFSTREEVLELLEKNSAIYFAWLDDLTPEKYGSMIEMPFGMGQIPVAMSLGFPAMHMRSHTSQIEYIQTIYGDHDWHM